MKIVDAKKAPVMENMHNVKASELYKSEHAVVVHIILEPGEELKPHITPVDVFFYIIEGSPDIKVGDETERVHADMLVESPANIPHCIYNNSQSVARILVVKVPKPTKATRLL